MLMRALSVHIAHETAGAARTRHSLRPLIAEGGTFPPKLARTARRDREAVFGNEMRAQTQLSSPGLDRATQYSRGADDRTERPRRTGSPAFAGDDSFGLAIPSTSLRAQRSNPFSACVEEWIASLRSQ